MRQTLHPIKLFAMVWCSLLVGMILTILPLPGWAVWWRPRWILLILLFWVVETQGRIGIGTAWLVGILVDLLTGTLLGQHALIMVFLVYLVINCYPRFRFYPYYQQILLMVLIVGLDLILNRWLMIFMQQPVSSRLYWFSALTSALIWPWIYTWLQGNRSLN